MAAARAELTAAEQTVFTRAAEAYESQFGRPPTVLGVAPGRVNLIGEHTDYNNGFVFPMAIPLCTVVVGGPSGDARCHVLTTSEEADSPHLVAFAPPSDGAPLTPGSEAKWANYVKGVVANFHDTVFPFNAVVASSVPLGGGLSSSASLEVATYCFLEALTSSSAISPKARALSCQRAEHQFAGVPCGIMDQLVAAAATPQRALLIDCRSLETEAVPLWPSSLCLLVSDSRVRHSLGASEYPLRRRCCEAAAKALGKDSLRDVTEEELAARTAELTPLEHRRARHVVGEIARTQRGAQALSGGDYPTFGKLMNESHQSLRDDFEVSCPELDQLVALAQGCEGVLGSRMTGGGFGGCTVSLVHTDHVEAVQQTIREGYAGDVSFLVVEAAGGARGGAV